MFKQLHCLIGCCLLTSAIAQTPHLTGADPFTAYASDSYVASALLDDEGQLICASDYGAILLMRTDAQGDLQWTKALEYDAMMESYLPAACGEWSNGDLFVFGTCSGGTDRYFVSRLTPQGGAIWTKYYDMLSIFPWDYGTSNAMARPNGHLLLSIAQFTNMIAVDIDGNGIMGYRWSFAFDDEKCPGLGCEPTFDDGTIFCGKDSSDQCMVRLDASGAVVWARTYENNDYTHARSVLPTSDGGYLVCGSHDNDYGGMGDAAYAMKLDANGDVLWHKTYSATGGTAFVNRFEKVLAMDGGGFAFFTDGALGDQVLVITNEMGAVTSATAMHYPYADGYTHQEMIGTSGSTIRLGGSMSYYAGSIPTYLYLDHLVAVGNGEGDCLTVPANVVASDVPAPTYPNAEVVIVEPLMSQGDLALTPGERAASDVNVCASITGIGDELDPATTFLRPNLALAGSTVELVSPGVEVERVMAIDALGRISDMHFTRMADGAVLSTSGLAGGHYTMRALGRDGKDLALPFVVQ